MFKNRIFKILILGILLLPKNLFASTTYQLEKEVVFGVVNFYIVEVTDGTSTRISGALNLPSNSNDFEPAIHLKGQNKFVVITDKYNNDTTSSYEATFDTSTNQSGEQDSIADSLIVARHASL